MLRDEPNAGLRRQTRYRSDTRKGPLSRLPDPIPRERNPRTVSIESQKVRKSRTVAGPEKPLILRFTALRLRFQRPAPAILRETSEGTSYQMVRLVFRPYTQLRRPICTSESLRTSTGVSSGFVPTGNSSPSFGSQRVRSRCTQQLKSARRVRPTLFRGKGSSVTFLAFTYA